MWLCPLNLATLPRDVVDSTILNVLNILDSNISAQELQECANWGWVFLALYLSQNGGRCDGRDGNPYYCFCYYHYYCYYCYDSSSTPGATTWTRRFQAFAFKWQTPQPLSSLSPSSPLPLPQSIQSSIPCPLSSDFPSLLFTHIAHRLIYLAFLHTLGVDSKRKASSAPRTPKLLSPPISYSCSRFSNHSEA